MEGMYYEHLLELLKSGEIIKIDLQPHMELIPAFERRGKKYRKMIYTPDFLVVRSDGSKVYIEIKGFAKTDALMRRKLFLYKYDEELIWITGTHKVNKKWTKWEDYDSVVKQRKLKKARVTK